MAREVSVELTNICIIYKNQEIVLIDRNYHGKHYNIFPGGHIEANESFKEAIIREIKEETNLTLNNPVFCGMKNYCFEDGRRYLVTIYKCNDFSGTLLSSKEGEVFWSTIEDFKEMEDLWNMHELLEIAMNDELSEFHYANGKWEVL